MMKQGVVAALLGAVLAWSSAVMADGMLNLNTATAKELAENLVGVGEVKAAAIVAYREQHGPYHSVDELVAVKGIGDHLLARNRDRLSIEAPAESPAASE